MQVFYEYWVRLQQEVDKKDILACANALQRMALSHQTST
jgi:hypothetical protein